MLWNERKILLQSEYGSLSPERFTCNPSSIEMLDQLREEHYTVWHSAKALNLSGVEENGIVLVEIIKGTVNHVRKHRCESMVLTLKKTIML